MSTPVNSAKLNIDLKARYVTALAVIAVAAVTFFRESLLQVFEAGFSREHSSHAVFIPLFMAYFVWLNRESILNQESRFEWPGIIFAAAALVAGHFTRAGVFQLNYILFVLFVLSVLFILLGRKVAGALAFPVLFLLTATPIPEAIYDMLANLSRTIALAGSLKIISVLGIPHFRDEWLIQLPTGLIYVNIACSGIRYFIAYVVFGMAYAYLFKPTFYQRLATMLCAVPISICASILRLTAIFTLSYYIDPRLADTRPHIVISWIVFFGVMAVAISVDRHFFKKGQARQQAALN